jgi:hypothetical protein
MGLRGQKIMMASITLPRPSQKGNLANVVAPILVNKNWDNGCRTRRENEKRKENEGEYRGMNSVARTLRG